MSNLTNPDKIRFHELRKFLFLSSPSFDSKNIKKNYILRVDQIASRLVSGVRGSALVCSPPRLADLSKPSESIIIITKVCLNCIETQQNHHCHHHHRGDASLLIYQNWIKLSPWPLPLLPYPYPLHLFVVFFARIGHNKALHLKISQGKSVFKRKCCFTHCAQKGKQEQRWGHSPRCHIKIAHPPAPLCSPSAPAPYGGYLHLWGTWNSKLKFHW